VRTINAGPSPKYFGYKRGITWLNAVNDQVAGVGQMVSIGSTSASKNTRYLDAIIEHLRGSGQPVHDEDVARLSPLGHAHLNCLGRQQSYDRYATRTHAIARTAASSDVTVRGSLAGRPVALASSGEALELPCVHAGHPVPAVLGRWADPRVAGNMGVTQGVHVRPILVDPSVYLINSADGPVAGDEDIDVVRRALEQPQRGELVLDRVRGVVQVEHRNQDIRKHVAGDENPAFLDQQRRMARACA
jgi:hypothetical protein